MDASSQGSLEFKGAAKGEMKRQRAIRGEEASIIYIIITMSWTASVVKCWMRAADILCGNGG
jgi:hypothetical protein